MRRVTNGWRSSLRSAKVGETLEFPQEFHSSIRGALREVKRDLRGKGIDFEVIHKEDILDWFYIKRIS